MSRYFRAHKREGRAKTIEPCPLCGNKAELVQDHCHKSGLNRDRICNRCNQLLGRIESPPANIEALLAYIARWRFEHAHGGTPYKAKPLLNSEPINAVSEG